MEIETKDSTKKIIIAVDGYSSCGKSTIAKQLAKKLSYKYIDTGAMYRAVTLYAIDNNLLDRKEQFIKALPNIQIQFEVHDDQNIILLDGIPVDHEIRTLRVASQVSKIASFKEVRLKMKLMQQEMGQEKGMVMDGRDIGTEIFPNAEVKLFMTADMETRVSRRYNELILRGDDITREAIRDNIKTRDEMDISREESPLRKAEDAIVIDNTYLTPEEQLERVLVYVKEIIPVPAIHN